MTYHLYQIEQQHAANTFYFHIQAIKVVFTILQEKTLNIIIVIFIQQINNSGKNKDVARDRTTDKELNLTQENWPQTVLIF